MSQGALRHHPGDGFPGNCFLGAPASYYCDIAHGGQLRIVLAQVVELILPPYRGLGLIARMQLEDAELACMDAIGRQLLARPFDYLHQECGRVRHSARPGGVIAALSAAHYTALQIAPPRGGAIPPSLAGGSPPCPTAVVAALGEMLQAYEGMDGPIGVATFCEAI